MTLVGWRAIIEAARAAGFVGGRRALQKLCARSRTFEPEIGRMPIAFDRDPRTADRDEIVAWLRRARVNEGGST